MSEGCVCVRPQGKISRAMLQATKRLGKLSSTPSNASCNLNSASWIDQCASGASAAWRPSSSKRLSVALIRYICESTSPKRADKRSRRFRLPPSTSIDVSASSAKAAE
ncbi:hypothetical protein D3C73_1481370 [compost metagenome]